MKYSIITPTYRRPDALLRAITSVLSQSHTDFEHIIINDNPGDGTKERVEALADDRIVFLEQASNSGVNAARNRGLSAIAPDSDRVIFLDDDDYLAPNALAALLHLIQTTKSPWLVTARGTAANTPTTHGTAARQYRYLRDYLVSRRFRGDATHCIDTTYIHGPLATLRFPTTIRQAEEWLFYAGLGQYTTFNYVPIVTTLTEGYATDGLNHRYRSTRSQLVLIPTLVHEGQGQKLLHHPFFWWYILIRVVRAFIKHT